MIGARFGGRPYLKVRGAGLPLTSVPIGDSPVRVCEPRSVANPIKRLFAAPVPGAPVPGMLVRYRTDSSIEADGCCWNRLGSRGYVCGEAHAGKPQRVPTAREEL